MALKSLTLVLASLHALLVCCFLPSSRLLVFAKCMESRHLVLEIDFWWNTRLAFRFRNSHSCVLCPPKQIVNVALSFGERQCLLHSAEPQLWWEVQNSVKIWWLILCYCFYSCHAVCTTTHQLKSRKVYSLVKEQWSMQDIPLKNCVCTFSLTCCSVQNNLLFRAAHRGNLWTYITVVVSVHS